MERSPSSQFGHSSSWSHPPQLQSRERKPHVCTIGPFPESLLPLPHELKNKDLYKSGHDSSLHALKVFWVRCPWCSPSHFPFYEYRMFPTGPGAIDLSDVSLHLFAQSGLEWISQTAWSGLFSFSNLCLTPPKVAPVSRWGTFWRVGCFQSLFSYVEKVFLVGLFFSLGFSFEPQVFFSCCLFFSNGFLNAHAPDPPWGMLTSVNCPPFSSNSEGRHYVSLWIFSHRLHPPPWTVT